MKIITANEYDACFENQDLAEAFEVFVQQRAYFEVLNVTSGIIARLDEFKVGELYNASAYFEHDGESYEFEKMREAGEISSTYFRFDTMAEAAQYAGTLLATVKEGV